MWRPSQKDATTAPHIQLGPKTYNFYYNFVTLSSNHINYTLPHADNPDLGCPLIYLANPFGLENDVIVELINLSYFSEKKKHVITILQSKKYMVI